MCLNIYILLYIYIHIAPWLYVRHSNQKDQTHLNQSGKVFSGELLLHFRDDDF